MWPWRASRTVSTVTTAAGSSSARERPPGRGRIVLLLSDNATPLGLVAGIVLASALLSFWSRTHYDVAWLLIGARRLLDGASLYTSDFVDVNPPLAVYVLTPAAASSMLASLPATTALRIQTLLVAVALLPVCWLLLARTYGVGRRLRPLYWVAAIAFATCVAPAMHLGGEGVAFAQREHWILMFTVPYLLLVALRLRGGAVSSGSAWTIGALMGLAVSMKPHFAAVWLGVEGLHFVLRANIRTVVRAETSAVAVVGALYLFLVWTTAPGYFAVALPLALNTYWAYQSPLVELLGVVPIGLCAAAAVAVRLTPAREPERTLAAVWVVGAVGSYVAFLLGGTTWTYHLLPFRGLVVLGLLAPVVARIPLASPDTTSVWASTGRAALAAVGVLAVLAASPGDAGRILRARGAHGSGGLNVAVQRLITEHGGGEPAVVLSTSVPPGLPAVSYAGVDWALRHSCLWPLPAVIRSRWGSAADRERLRPEQADEIEAYVRRTLVEDLEKRPPGIVLVPQRGWMQGVGKTRIDLLEFLRRDPRFAAVWAHYRPLKRVGNMRAFVRAGTDSSRRQMPGRPRGVPAHPTAGNVSAPSTSDAVSQ